MVGSPKSFLTFDEPLNDKRVGAMHYEFQFVMDCVLNAL